MIVASAGVRLRHLQHYRVLFERAPVPYLVLDGRGQIEELNPAAARLLGAERALLERRSFVGVAGVIEPQRFGRWLERCRQGAPVSGELELALGGAPRRVRVEASPSETGGMLLMLIDCAACDEAQKRELREALVARDEMLAVVAHDLGNPLATVLLVTQLLQHLVTRADQQRLVRNLEHAARRMKRLVGDLLDTAALEAGKLSCDPRPQAASELVCAALVDLDTAAAQRQIRVETTLPPEGLRVRADPGRVLQVLGNLLGNALKFTPPGGRITLGAEPVIGGARFFVSDSGPGIPEEQQARLFDRFWKGQKQGTGLGLYIAKRILDAHGTAMDVESRVGEGSRFSFILPEA